MYLLEHWHRFSEGAIEQHWNRWRVEFLGHDVQELCNLHQAFHPEWACESTLQHFFGVPCSQTMRINTAA